MTPYELVHLLEVQEGRYFARNSRGQVLMELTFDGVLDLWYDHRTTKILHQLISAFIYRQKLVVANSDDAHRYRNLLRGNGQVVSYPEIRPGTAYVVTKEDREPRFVSVAELW